WASRLLVRLAADDLPRIDEIAFDWRVFAFLAVMSLIVAVAFGLVPAWFAMRGNMQQQLRTGERGAAAPSRARDVLVIAEIAIAFVLLAGAGLLMRTFVNLQRTPTGFETAGVLTVHVTLTNA